jgi:hypothetical protein
MAAMAASAADLRPLPGTALLAGAGFGLVLLALLVADVALAVRVPLLGVWALAATAMARHLRRSAPARVLEWDGRGGWTLDGRAVAVRPSTRVYPGLVVLALRLLPTANPAPAGPRGDRGATTVHWVSRRTVAPAAFRHLKQQLRHGRGARTAVPPAEIAP